MGDATPLFLNGSLPAIIPKSVYRYANMVRGSLETPRQTKLDHDVSAILGSSDPPAGFGFLHPRFYSLEQNRPTPMEPLQVRSFDPFQFSLSLGIIRARCLRWFYYSSSEQRNQFVFKWNIECVCVARVDDSQAILSCAVHTNIEITVTVQKQAERQRRREKEEKKKKKKKAI